MANIQVWNGSSSFSPGQTPFGFYDNDSTFVADIDKVARWCSYRLGFPIVEVELQSGSFYAAFEEAITTYGNEVYQYMIAQNYLSMEGNNTDVSFNNQVITPNLGTLIRISETYATEAGTGGLIDFHTGSFNMISGEQDYDLKSILSSSYGITSSVEIKRVFYEAPPAIVRYFDPYAGTGTGMQSLLETFGFGQMSPGINFLLMPIHFDIQKIQAIEFNDQIRKAAYSFNLINNKLKIFPIPTPNVDGLPMYFEYIFIDERDSVTNNSINSGLIISGSTTSNNIVTNISNVPYTNPVYGQINSVGTTWIRQYALAVVKEMLAYVRGKYSSIPIPKDQITLNQNDLLTDARKEKDALLEQLRAILDQTSRKNQLEQQVSAMEDSMKMFSAVPLPFYIF